MFQVLRVFHIAVRHIDRQRYSTLSLGLLNSPNLAAGITGVKLVEPVLNARKIVVYAVRVNGVVVVVNGNVANAILGKSEVCVQTCQGRIASQSGQILRDNDSYTPRFNLDQHTLKAGAVVVRAGISIVHKEHRVRKVILLSVFQKNSLLRWNLSRGFSAKHNVSENSVQNICRAVSPQRMRIIGSMVFFYL